MQNRNLNSFEACKKLIKEAVSPLQLTPKGKRWVPKEEKEINDGMILRDLECGKCKVSIVYDPNAMGVDMLRFVSVTCLEIDTNTNEEVEVDHTLEAQVNHANLKHL